MTLQDLGAIGEVVGGFAVVVSLVYVAYQIRQSSRQIEQNSRHIEASMYYATNDAFYRWFALLAQDAELAALWGRVLRGETLEREEQLRVNGLVAMLLLSYENNFQQNQLGAVRRDTLALAGPSLAALLSRPALQTWWQRESRRVLTPEFRSAVEALLAREAASQGPGGAGAGGSGG